MKLIFQDTLRSMTTIVCAKRISSSESSVEDKEFNMKIDTTKNPIPEVDNQLMEDLLKFDLSEIQQKESVKVVNKKQAAEIIQQISKVKDISYTSALGAIATLFRKGAANAKAADSMFVDIYSQETGVATEISRYDIIVAMQRVAGHKTIRKFAEILAPEMISVNLKLIELNPLLDLKGDLANRINRKLVLKKLDTLTRKEEICCCTYAQWMPNLNDLAESNRLKTLLEEDLYSRRKGKKGIIKPKPSKK